MEDYYEEEFIKRIYLISITTTSTLVCVNKIRICRSLTLKRVNQFRTIFILKDMEGKKNTAKLNKVNLGVLEIEIVYHQTSLKIVPGEAECNFAGISSSLKWERSTEEIKKNWLCAQFDAGELRESAPSRGISNSYFILSLNCPLCVQSLRRAYCPWRS